MKKLLVALLIPTVCFAQTFKQRDINGYVYDFEVSTVFLNMTFLKNTYSSMEG